MVSEHPFKALSVIFETEIVIPCLVQKLKWGVVKVGVTTFAAEIELSKMSNVGIIYIMCGWIFCYI